MISAQDVAAELRQRRPDLGTMKLHKLLYYCQGHHLATFGRPLFPETISAWDMGPVVGTLWRQEKENGAASSDVDLDEGVLNTIGYVLSRYGALTGNDLKHLTHSETPWLQANVRRAPATSVRIDRDAIEDYFRRHDVDDDESIPLDADEVARWLEGSDLRTAELAPMDSIEDIRARLHSA
jgi:uncharacterized phage-associated protein